MEHWKEHHLRMTEKDRKLGLLGHTYTTGTAQQNEMKHVMLRKQWMIDLLEMRIVRSRNKIRFRDCQMA